MVRPIHRVPRYKLLLESELFIITAHAHGELLIILFIEYIKYLPKDHPDLVNANGMIRFHCSNLLTLSLCTWHTAALAAISDALKYMNSRITEIVGYLLLCQTYAVSILDHMHAGKSGRTVEYPTTVCWQTSTWSSRQG